VNYGKNGINNEIFFIQVVLSYFETPFEKIMKIFFVPYSHEVLNRINILMQEFMS